MVVFLPVGSDQKDVSTNYDLTVVYLSPSRWLRELFFDADVSRVLERLSDWGNSLEDNRETSRPLGRENVSSCGTSCL